MARGVVILLLLFAGACADDALVRGGDDAAPLGDASTRDGAGADVPPSADATPPGLDAAPPPDAGTSDAWAPDAGTFEAGTSDAADADAAPLDAAAIDAGAADAGLLACAQGVPPSAALDVSVVLSQPAHSALVPVIAARDDAVLIAWHEFAGTSTSAVHYVVIHDGCPGVERAVPERAPTQLRPSVAVTPDGFVLAYHVQTSSGSAVRAVWLAPDGSIRSGPETISGAAGGVYARVATRGANTAFAWIAAGAHWFALRGAETVTATVTGVPIMSTVVLNSPRPALDSTGALHLAYRDGGTSSEDWDALLITRQRGGTFSRPLNLSRTPGLLTDDLAITVEPDDRLDVLWVQQDGRNVNSFEIEYAIVGPLGASPSRRFAVQGQWAWMPAVAPGLRAVWHTGGGGSGPLHFADGPVAPRPILPGIVSDGATIAVAPSGSLHIATGEHTTPRHVRYAWRR